MVTPSKADYWFIESSKTIHLLNNEVINFVGIEIPGYCSLSGTIKNEAGVPISGVDVTVECFSDDYLTYLVMMKYTTSNNNGYYIVSDVPAGLGVYILKPRNGYYSFDPPMIWLENLNSDITLLNFTCRKNKPLYSIYGTIKDKNGISLRDVTATFICDNYFSQIERTTTTDINGYYILSELSSDYTITVKPSKADYWFAPAERSIGRLDANIEMNFTGGDLSSLDYYSVSGTIRNEAAVPVSGMEVVVGCYEYSNVSVLSKSTTSDNNGYYIVSVPAGFNYYILSPTIPIDTGYYFNPPYIQFENLNSDITFDLIYKKKQFYSISGTIKEANGTPISDVEVTYIDHYYDLHRTVADINGFYILSNLPEFEEHKFIIGTLRPYHSDYYFEPFSVEIQNLNSNLTWDFIGTKESIFYSQVSGTIKYKNGAPVDDYYGFIAVDLIRGEIVERSTTPDINGFYCFQNVKGSSSIRPSTCDVFVFNPSIIYIHDVNPETTNLDFIATKIWKIYCRIQDENGTTLRNVTVRLSGDVSETIIDDEFIGGWYVFSNLPEGGSYTVTPSCAGYFFELFTVTINNLFPDQTIIFAAKVISVDKPDKLPTGYSLGQNYPNPFNPSTKIKYTIKESGFVAIHVFDIFGREVKKLVNTFQPSGNYEITFDAKDLTSGVYYYKININEFTATKKMLLMK